MESLIIGQWSTIWFYDDPGDEVIVFLPGGRGVIEYHWWRLNAYETFNYHIEDDIIAMVGDTLFSYDSERGVVEQHPSRLDFTGLFWLRLPTDDEAEQGCEEILELEDPIVEHYAATDKFGRKLVHRNVDAYSLPTFDEDAE